MEIKATKKQVTVSAWLWDGENHRGMFEFLGGKHDEPIGVAGNNFYIDHGKGNKGLVIRTSEGDMFASVGDFIIKDPFDKERGFYPCKPDIFHLTYDINLSTTRASDVNIYSPMNV